MCIHSILISVSNPFFSLRRLFEDFLYDEANAFEVTVRDRLCEDTRDDLAITEVVFLPVTAIPDLGLSKLVAVFVE